MVTWNVNDKATGCILYNNNLTADCSTGSYPAVRCTEAKTNGKWYFELTYEQVYNNGFGICTKNFSFNNWLGGDSSSFAYFGHRGGWWSSGSSKSPAKIILKAGDTLGILLDCDNKTLQSVVNGVLQDDKITYALTGDVYVAFGKVAEASGKLKGTVNFGLTSFDLYLKNNQLWSDLVSQGYKPYDYKNSFYRKYLLKQGGQYYTLKDNYLVLLDSQTLDETNFNANGFSNLDLLTQVSNTYKITKSLQSNICEFDIDENIEKIEVK